jgi:hypothetical protein
MQDGASATHVLELGPVWTEQDFWFDLRMGGTQAVSCGSESNYRVIPENNPYAPAGGPAEEIILHEIWRAAPWFNNAPPAVQPAPFSFRSNMKTKQRVLSTLPLLSELNGCRYHDDDLIWTPPPPPWQRQTWFVMLGFGDFHSVTVISTEWKGRFTSWHRPPNVAGLNE